jgi:peptidoglycan/LPS O-acetylase OafA/YrhL
LIGHKLYGHLNAFSVDHYNHITLRLLADVVKPFSFGGGAGVVVFFLISGYIIANVLMDEDTPNFILKRILRIYPVYVVAVFSEIAITHFTVGSQGINWPQTLARLSLLGDWFGTPYGLAGVEWTLRIEIHFYAVMAILKWTGIWRRFEALPFIFLGFTVLLQILGPFTLQAGFARGYVTLYMPFLFFGAIFLLLEKKLCNPVTGILCLVYIYLSYLTLLPRINPGFAQSHFASLALIIFLVAWFFRRKLQPNYWTILLADLTYSVYLFHNWLWDHIIRYTSMLVSSTLLNTSLTIMCLLFFCYLVNLTIEKPSIRFGALLNKKLRALQTAKLPQPS